MRIKKEIRKKVLAHIDEGKLKSEKQKERWKRKKEMEAEENGGSS